MQISEKMEVPKEVIIRKKLTNWVQYARRIGQKAKDINPNIFSKFNARSQDPSPKCKDKEN